MSKLWSILGNRNCCQNYMLGIFVWKFESDEFLEVEKIWFICCRITNLTEIVIEREHQIYKQCEWVSHKSVYNIETKIIMCLINNIFFCIFRKNGALESCQVAYSTCSNLCQQQTKSCFSSAVQLELKKKKKNSWKKWSAAQLIRSQISPKKCWKVPNKNGWW